MNWLWALHPLFESLRSFLHDNKQRHLEKTNFLDALDKVKPTLDLKDPDSLAFDTTETVISFQTVWAQFEEHLPEFFTWDNLFDVLLFQTVACQFVYDLHAPAEVFDDELSATSLCYDGEESANVPDAGALIIFNEVAPLTNTVTVLSDPVMRKD